MPAILERCVQHVMEQGHSQSSAFAICRASLNLNTDGSQDGMESDMTDEQMRGKVATHMQFGNTPVLVKRMMIAKPIGEFINGPDQKGTITRERLASLVEKQKKYPRQIPIYLLGDHPPSNDQRPADGYVENLSLDAEGNLWADPAKLNGTAAEWVANDRIRGASIFTKRGADYDGAPIGEFLKHVLLSDEGFMRDLNVAASRFGGAESAGVGFTAFKKKGAAMAEKKESVTPPTRAEIEDPKALELINSQENEILRLKAENLALTEQVENVGLDPEKDELKERVQRLELKSKAQEIREMVMSGLQRGTLKSAWCGDFKKGGDVGTLRWFEASRFQGDMKLLKYQVEQSEPIVSLNQRFSSGAPGDQPQQTLNQEDRQWLRSHGIDPDKGAIAAKSRDLSEYRRHKAAEKGAN